MGEKAAFQHLYVRNRWILLKGYSGVSFPTASLSSFSNLRKDSTITTHCSLCLQPRNHHQKATNDAQNSIKLQQQYKQGPSTQFEASNICQLCWISVDKRTQLTTLLQQRGHCGEALTTLCHGLHLHRNIPLRRSWGRFPAVFVENKSGIYLMRGRHSRDD